MTEMENIWYKFIEQCKRLDFANERILTPHQLIPSDRETEEDLIIDIDDIVGSDVYGNQTWMDRLKEYRYPIITGNRAIEDIANSAYESLTKTDYSLLSYENENKYYISDGHNRLIFLKFYIKLFNKSSKIKVSQVVYYKK